MCGCGVWCVVCGVWCVCCVCCVCCVLCGVVCAVCVVCVARMIHNTASLSWRVPTMHLIGWQNTWEQAPGVPPPLPRPDGRGATCGTCNSSTTGTSTTTCTAPNVQDHGNQPLRHDRDVDDMKPPAVWNCTPAQQGRGPPCQTVTVKPLWPRPWGSATAQRQGCQRP